MILLYNIFIRLYSIGIWFAAFFDPKVKKLKQGRAEIFTANFPDKKNKRVWVHCASLGEFEQGRPIIESIKQHTPETEIILSFFSPSGYEIREDYAHADIITYLPSDTQANAKRFIEQTNPDLAIFIKYEFWYHFLNTLSEKNIPTYLCSAIFRKEHFTKGLYSSFFKKMLGSFDQIFVQNQSSLEQLKANGFEQVILNGDTRIDRVLQIREEQKHFPIVEKFATKSRVFVMGSSWPKDESVLLSFIDSIKNENWKFIIAPHNIDEKYIQSIQKNLNKKSVRFSKADEASVSENDVLIIDNIGMLSSIYQYGEIAYIGGGFGKGIHNILEPAAFHLPIIIGPNYQKFEEANVLVNHKGVFVINNLADMNVIFNNLNDPTFRQTASLAIKKYIESNRGATTQIVDKVLQELL